MPIVNPYTKNKRKDPPPPAPYVAPPTTTTTASAGSTFSQAFDEKTLQQKRENQALLQAHALTVSPRQQGNHVLKCVRNVPIAYSDIVPDFIFSSTRCGLFLTCSWHREHKEYIHTRIAELRNDFQLRVLLVLVNVDDNVNILRSLNHIAVTNSMTLLLAWSEEEAARYLETLKAFDGKDASSIQKRTSQHFSEQVADFLGKTVNKTDSAQLLSQFSNLRSLAAASVEEIGLVQGMGPVKVRKLYDALHKPFSKRKTKEREARLENGNADNHQDDEIGNDDEEAEFE